METMMTDSDRQILVEIRDTLNELYGMLVFKASPFDRPTVSPPTGEPNVGLPPIDPEFTAIFGDRPRPGRQAAWKQHFDKFDGIVVLDETTPYQYLLEQHIGAPTFIDYNGEIQAVWPQIQGLNDPDRMFIVPVDRLQGLGSTGSVILAAKKRIK